MHILRRRGNCSVDGWSCLIHLSQPRAPRSPPITPSARSNPTPTPSSCPTPRKPSWWGLGLGDRSFNAEHWVRATAASLHRHHPRARSCTKRAKFTGKIKGFTRYLTARATTASATAAAVAECGINLTVKATRLPFPPLEGARMVARERGEEHFRIFRALYRERSPPSWMNDVRS